MPERPSGHAPAPRAPGHRPREPYPRVRPRRPERPPRGPCRLDHRAERGGLSVTLLIADTAGIQPYIFGSNRLRENIGASHLVAQATGGWALDAVRAAAPRHNIGPDRLTDAWMDDGLDA